MFLLRNIQTNQLFDADDMTNYLKKKTMLGAQSTNDILDYSYVNLSRQLLHH